MNRYILLTTKNSRLAGGLYTAIAGLCNGFLKITKDVSILSYDDAFSLQDEYLYGNIEMSKYLVSNIPVLKHFGYSNNLLQKLNTLAPKLLDVQGIWMYNSMAALRYQKNHPDIKKVITPHGMLDPWAVNNSGWKKKIVGWLFEYENLRTADCIHALCESEYESIRQFGLKCPVAIIPNGVDIPENAPIDRNKDKKVLLYISRIHPKKGIKEMIEGVALLKKEKPELLSNWTIRIAGWNQRNHQEELQALCGQLGVNNYIEFIGPVFGEAKEKELCKADAFILPSFSEGLPMSILEAWAYQLPCVMTYYCNLPEGFSTNSAIEVMPSAEDIASGICQLFSLSDEGRMRMGKNGYELCVNNFSWDVIAKQTLKLYNFLLEGGEKPDFLYYD